MFVYLASQSPRRRQLLEQVGVAYEPLLPGVEEDAEALEAVCAGESPAAYVQRVTHAKADAAVQRWQRRQLTLDDRILGKPANAADAVAMLRQLSGRRHQVLTALVLHDPASGQRQSACSVSDVWFDTLDDARIDAYVATGEPFGKAGGYGIQGRAATWVARIEGSFSGIVGLPLFELDQLLRADRAGRAGGPG